MTNGPTETLEAQAQNDSTNENAKKQQQHKRRCRDHLPGEPLALTLRKQDAVKKTAKAA